MANPLHMLLSGLPILSRLHDLRPVGVGEVVGQTAQIDDVVGSVTTGGVV